MSNKGITPKEENYSQWYLDILDRADLAENSPVRGCMVIKPFGYAIWENIQQNLDAMIKESGAKNVYFPIFIPKSFLSREADHVKGFAKECAIVTHHRLRETADGKGVEVDPDSKLEEELIVRPTSETIMYDTFSRWITSWRDLPFKVNQWANVVRWEMRTRPFLRTAEFLWQEGHTVHKDHEEGVKEALDRLEMYSTFARDYLAIPTYTGRKSESEKFAGALNTYGVEALMMDGKVLQFGTTHDLGQNFAKVFNIQFADTDGQLKNPWQTSWGVSTRMIGGIIMSHSDNNGLVLPPNISPIKIIIIPIFNEENREEVLQYIEKFKESLGEKVEVDDRDFVSPGYKFNEWEKKGVPLRVEVGSKDIEKGVVTVVRRDTGEKIECDINSVGAKTSELLVQIQDNLLNNAQKRLEESTYEVDTYEEFKDRVKEGGFVKMYWCGDENCANEIKSDTKATTRCIAEENLESGKCVHCGKECNEKWYFAISY